MATIRFNDTHSGDLALYAVVLDREIGIDVERVDPTPDVERILMLFASTLESAVYRTLPPEEKQEAFYRWWTRKEAYLKAIGMGLTERLSAYTVAYARGQRDALLHVEGNPEAPLRWSMVGLEPADGFVGALVVERGPVELHFRSWI
jgi:4'-phosphopantetheinyl transferase